MASAAVGAMFGRHIPRCRKLCDARIPSVSHASSVCLPKLSVRFLVDTDQEVEGLAVIADFQGRDLDDELVIAEYKEIRDAVLADVSLMQAKGARPDNPASRWRSIV